MRNKREKQTDEEGFRKSSWSVKNPVIRFCVSVKITDVQVMIRDTKDATKTTLTFTHGEWDAFIKGAKNCEFDIKS